jgi:hypothetical protein
MAAAARKAPDGRIIYVARESFSAELDGVPVAVVKGQTRVREGHPLLDGRESLFEPVTVHYDVDASPVRGETRG